MAKLDDEQRALLHAYACSTRPNSSDIDRALTRTLARIEHSKRPGRLPSRRGRVWVVAAALAALVLATAAMAALRWLRTQPQLVLQDNEQAHHNRPADASSRGRLEAGVGERELPRVPEPPSPEPPASATDDDAAVVDPPRDEPQPKSKQAASTPRPRAEPERAKSSPKPLPKASEPAPPTASELADESRLLGRIRKALDAGHFDVALDWAEEHARRHPHGALSEERLILEAVAACRGGQLERGRASLASLRRRFPGTPALAKIEHTCG